MKSLARWICALILTAVPLYADTIPEELRSRWIEAVRLMRADAPRQAVPHLEWLSGQAPDHWLIRTELALAYRRAGNAQSALHHFNRALGGNLTPEQRRAIEREIDTLSRERNWQAGFSLALVPSSNAGRSTREEYVRLGGLLVRLDQQPEAATGLAFHGRLAWQPRLGPDLRAVLAVSAFGTAYSERRWNDHSLRLEAGILRFGDRGLRFGGGILAGERWLGSENYSRELGGYLEGGRRLGARTRLHLRAEHVALEVPRLPARSGQVSRLNLAFTHVPSPRWEIRGRVGGILNLADGAHERYRQLLVGLGASHAFDGGWVVGVDLSQSWGRYAGVHPVFGRQRSEDEQRVRAQISNRRMAWRGFSPMLEIGHERRNASIGVYQYRNNYATFRIARDF